MSESNPEFEPQEEPEPLAWRVPLLLFVLTVFSTLYVGVSTYDDAPFPSAALRMELSQHSPRVVLVLLGWLLKGWWYAAPLLTILLAHEFGHYFMARKHRVPASLPMFLPVPMPPFGTFGAVIRMRSRIQDRNALLDIGASGPLAGLLLAIPIAFLGLRHSRVQPIIKQGVWMQEGTSVLFALLKKAAVGTIPDGHDVYLHPVAMAGWVGMFVTMINLIPFGQLDGGHVAFALLGERHHKIARWVLGGLVLLGVVTGLYWGAVMKTQHQNPWEFGTGYTQGMNWFVFAGLVWFMHRGYAGKHPPTDPGVLTPARRVVAAVTLVLFLLLFMPVPLRIVSY